MRNSTTLLVATVAMSTLLWAGGLKKGSWTGTITPPNGTTNEVVYTVDETGGDSTISMAFAGTSFDFRDVKVADDHITFAWSPGSADLECRLDLQNDHSYKGTCADAGGGTGHLTMVPPE